MTGISRVFVILEFDMTDTNPAPSPAPSFDYAKWEAERAREAELNAQVLSQNKAALFDVLAATGIATVTVVFDGYGDSGQVENIEAKTSDDKVVDLPSAEIEIALVEWGVDQPLPVRLGVHDAIERLAYAFLSNTHCGWENNDGAYGEFVFDVSDRTISLDYNERFTSSENHGHEW